MTQKLRCQPGDLVVVEVHTPPMFPDYYGYVFTTVRLLTREETMNFPPYPVWKVSPEPNHQGIPICFPDHVLRPIRPTPAVTTKEDGAALDLQIQRQSATRTVIC